MIRDLVSAGSMTSSTSKISAAFTIRDRSYIEATSRSNSAARSSGSSMLARCCLAPKVTAPSIPMPPTSPVGQPTVNDVA